MQPDGGTGVVAGLGIGASSAALLLLPVVTPALAASPPDTVDTGDPPPPADPTVPGGLDDAGPPPDDSIVEMPPTSATVVQNANTLPIAWVGTPGPTPGHRRSLTLQAALNAAPAGGTVSFDPNDYAFTGALLVPSSVTLDSSAASTLYARFTVNGGGLALADDVTIGAANTGAIITVAASTRCSRTSPSATRPLCSVRRASSSVPGSPGCTSTGSTWTARARPPPTA